MDVSINLWTDGALLAIFDPALFESSGPEPHTYQENKEVQEGRYTWVRLQGDQTFRARITDASLTAREQELLNETLGPLGLVVRSGQAYISGMDLPGEPTESYAKHGAGGFVAIAPGEYNLYVHEIDLLSLSEAEQKELPDYVIELQTRCEPFPGITTSLRFLGGRKIERLMEELQITYGTAIEEKQPTEEHSQHKFL